MSEIILIRTHLYDYELDRFVYRLLTQTGRKIVIVADERNGVVECPPAIQKLSLEPNNMGLFMTPDAAWRCGDYALYAAMLALPDATAFWLIEPDVRIHASDLKSLFDGADGGLEADLLTAWFTVSSSAWAWHATIKPFAKEVYNCMLQLCRFSRQAVEHLYAKRLALSSIFAAGEFDPNAWPNDEAFIGAALMEGGFVTGTLKRHAPAFVTDGTFGFTKPVSRAWLERLPDDQHIYHPVVGGQKFLQRAAAYLFEKESAAMGPDYIVREFGKAFMAQVEMEVGKPAAVQFYHRVRDAAMRSDDRMRHGACH